MASESITFHSSLDEIITAVFTVLYTYFLKPALIVLFTILMICALRWVVRVICYLAARIWRGGPDEDLTKLEDLRNLVFEMSDMEVRTLTKACLDVVKRRVIRVYEDPPAERALKKGIGRADNLIHFGE